jgi:hypothetical protein
MNEVDGFLAAKSTLDRVLVDLEDEKSFFKKTILGIAVVVAIVVKWRLFQSSLRYVVELAFLRLFVGGLARASFGGLQFAARIKAS